MERNLRELICSFNDTVYWQVTRNHISQFSAMFFSVLSPDHLIPTSAPLFLNLFLDYRSLDTIMFEDVLYALRIVFLILKIIWWPLKNLFNAFSIVAVFLQLTHHRSPFPYLTNSVNTLFLFSSVSMFSCRLTEQVRSCNPTFRDFLSTCLFRWSTCLTITFTL